LPAKRWRRRLNSLQTAYPERAAIPGGVDPTLLTPEERWELGRIMDIVERRGLAACSQKDVQLFLCFGLKLKEQSTECCLCLDE
jgi:hypothetical protein